MVESAPGEDDRLPPLVSLVIPSRTGGPSLLACIESFARGGDDQFEIIVAAGADTRTIAGIGGRFPSVRILPCPASHSIPDLRATGLRAARGAIIALTSDHCRAGDGWLHAVRRSHQNSAAAVGGAIENGATEKLVDWAVFFCEYGRYMLPLAGEATSDLPGQNVSYRRDAIDVFGDLLAPACWEPLWHWRLQARGLSLVSDGSIVVSLHKHFSCRGFIAERYHYARSFAGQRSAGRPWLHRAGWAAGTPLLPPVVLLRLGRQILPKRRHRRELLFSIPYLVVFALAWAVGECVGYVAGPGTSARHIS